ncbi:hypothetical protein Anas_03331, partial [Armadillidium nasatum]
MAVKGNLLFILIICLVNYVVSIEAVNVVEETVTYVGAVIEYEPYNIWDDEGKGYGVLQKNIEAVSSAARIAKLQFFTYTTYVPDPSDLVVPCNTSEANPNIEGLKLLSCVAKQESIYLVVNLLEAHPCSEETISSAPWSEYKIYDEDVNCPDSGFYFHNTETVLDRTGAVIARSVSGNICFDIGFEDPAYNNVRNRGIKNVISSTAWVDYLPFNTADLTQDGWSRGLKVNLLISGYHLPEEAKMGSGIYRQQFDEPPVYVYDKDSGNVLLVAEVKTTIETTQRPQTAKHTKVKKIQDKRIHLNTEEEEEEERVHVVFHERLQDYTSSSLLSGDEGDIFTVDVCGVDNFCCNLKYQYTGNLTYMLIALKGQFEVGGRY